MGLDTKVFVGDEREMYHRMAEWYKSPECEGLRVAWGPYPATQDALQSWPGFVAVTNAFLDDAEANASSGEVELEPVKSSGATKWGTVVWGTVVSAAEEGVITEQPSASEGHEGGRGSLEFLGLWKENNEKIDRLLPIRREGYAYYHWQDRDDFRHKLRVAFGKLVDELVRNKAPSGILATTEWTETGTEGNTTPYWGISWSASPNDESYQQLGLVSMQAEQHEMDSDSDMDWDSDVDSGIRFADFDGAINMFGIEEANAVYRVTLPSRGLDPEKWVGRPPPPAPEELYTGPRSDGLLSTDEVSGEYSAAVYHDRNTNFPWICNSMTVVPLGADTIETWHSGLLFFPMLTMWFTGPCAGGDAWTREPGTNAFVAPKYYGMTLNQTFSADGTVSNGFKKRPGSQKRTFQKVETRDLAGNWHGCSCSPFLPFWPLSCFWCISKKALNQDQYASTRIRCLLCLPIPYPCPCEAKTWTRKYANGHPTNGFYRDGAGDNSCGDPGDPNDTHWYRDPGCAAAGCFFAKKVG